MILYFISFNCLNRGPQRLQRGGGVLPGAGYFFLPASCRHRDCLYFRSRLGPAFHEAGGEGNDEDSFALT